MKAVNPRWWPCLEQLPDGTIYAWRRRWLFWWKRVKVTHAFAVEHMRLQGIRLDAAAGKSAESSYKRGERVNGRNRN